MLRAFWSSLLLCSLVCALTWLSPRSAHADAQYSARLSLGAGKRFADIDDEVGFETGVRAEAMFGPPRHRSFRVGPALEVRTLDFATIEAGAGAGVLVPTGDFALGIVGLLEYAARKVAPDGLLAVGTLSWGYRGYNYHSAYGWGLHLYASARKSITGDDVLEFTGGVEIDFMFIAVVPALAIKNLFTKDDPHE